MEPTMTLMDVSPEMAEYWLEGAAQNRVIRRYRVLAYAADMTAGRWHGTDSAETIKIDTEGRLFDGQHRLQAVIEAGIEVPLWIAENCDPAAMNVVDSGIARTYGDALGIGGLRNAKTVAAVNMRMFLWDHGIYLVSRKEFQPDGATGFRAPSRPELRLYLFGDKTADPPVEGHPEIIDFATLATHWKIPRIGPAAVASLGILFARKNEEACHEFMTAWATGADLAKDSPVLALRERLDRDTLVVSGGAPLPSSGRTSDVKMALAIRAWNLVRAGEPAMKLQLPRGGLTNENFPQPK